MLLGWWMFMKNFHKKYASYRALSINKSTLKIISCCLASILNLDQPVFYQAF